MSTDPDSFDRAAQAPRPGPVSTLVGGEGGAAEEEIDIGYEAAYPLLQTPLWCEEVPASPPRRAGS